MMPRVRNEFSDITTDCAYEYLMDRLQEMRRQDEEEPQTTQRSSSSTSRSNSTGSSSPRLLTMPILSKLQNAVQPCEFILAPKQGSFMLTHFSRNPTLHLDAPSATVRPIAPLVVGRFAAGVVRQ